MTDTKQDSTTTDPRVRHEAATAGLGRVLALAREVFGCDALGVLTPPASAPSEVLGASDAAAREAELLQVELAEGPSVRTGDDLGVVVSGDVRHDPRWRRWGPATARLGWSSVLTAPLDAADHRLGMLTLYSRRPGSWDPTHAYAACLFAQYAATMLVATADAAQLRETVERRRDVGLAQGVLMEQHGLDADAALDMLRRHSEANDVTLRAVSEHVIHTGLLPSTVKPQMRVRRRSPL